MVLWYIHLKGTKTFKIIWFFLISIFSYEGWFSQALQTVNGSMTAKIQISNPFDLIITKNNIKHGKITTWL